MPISKITKKFLSIKYLLLCMVLVMAFGMVMKPVTVEAASSGTYRGVSWSIDDDGLLTIGKEGQTQIFTNARSQYASDWPWRNSSSSIKSVKFAGKVIGQGSMGFMFYFCSNLTSVDVSAFDTHLVTDMNNMFYYCTGLTSLDLSSLDTSSVTNMYAMFYNCSKLASLNLSSFDTSNVTNMSYMFYACHALNSLDLSSFDTSKVRTMENMFYNCYGLTSLDVSSFNTGSVTNMGYMFYYCNKLTSLDLSSFDMSSVTNMSGMLTGCSVLKSVKLGENFKALLPENGSRKWIRDDGAYGPYTIGELRDNYTSEMAGTWELVPSAYAVFDSTDGALYFVKSSDVFNNGSSGTVHSISGGEYTGTIYTVSETYSSYNWNSMRLQVNKVQFIDEIKPKSTYQWFVNFSNCTEMDLRKLNMSEVTDMGSMFSGCSKLQSVKLGENFTASLPANGSGLWIRDDGVYGPYTSSQFRTNYTSEIAGTWVLAPSAYAVFDSTDGTLYFVKSYDLFSNNSTGTVHSISGGEYTGSIYTVSETYSSHNWSSKASQVTKVQFVDVIKPISTTGWFSNFTKCTEMDLDKLNTSNVTDMRAMFNYCIKLTSLDVSSFNTSNVTDMEGMFYGCYGLTSLDVSKFDTSNVTTMTSMFYQCNKLTSLDLSSFITEKVTKMDYMFQSCTKLTSLNVSKFDTRNVTDMKYMFSNCKNLVSLDLSSFNTNSVTNMMSMFDNCSSLTSLDVSSFNTSSVTNMYQMFVNCSSLISLNLSLFDTSSVTNMSIMFYGCSGLRSIKLGETFRFDGKGGISDSYKAILPTPSGSEYSGKWVLEDDETGESAMTPAEMRDAGIVTAGTWVWELKQYTIEFNAPEDAVGSMTSVRAVPTTDYTLPANKFSMFGYDFDHWEDGNGKTYADKDIIPANRYSTGTVTLTAVFVLRDTSFTMEDGSFEIKLRAGEKAVLPDLPAGTAYQVYEQTPDGWVLVKQENASGVIQPLTESNAVFHNKYQPGVTTAQFSGIKTLDGNPASAGSYNFELKDADGNIIETVSTLEGGFIQFSVIQYEEVGTYEYTINEVDPDDPSIDYDTHIEHIKVVVTDDGHGNLSSEVTYDSDGIVFNNKTRPGSLRITKEASGVTDANKDDTFAFKIHFYNANGTPVEDGQIYWYIEGED